MKRIPIGLSDFKHLIEEDFYYFDKTKFIDEIIQDGAQVKLFTRPRRFGKTLNMSMLKYFFDIKEAEKNKKLFKDLYIEKTESFKEQGQYPVIFLSLKDLKATTWEEMQKDIKSTVARLFSEYKYLLKDLDKFDTITFENVIMKNIELENLKEILKFLTKILYEKYSKKVVILIDEYDSPLVSAYTNGYYEKVKNFFKTFYSTVLKDNTYLQMGILTGIIRVIKAGIFSDLNNLRTYTILSDVYTDSYGLTEEEVKESLKYYGIETERTKSFINPELAKKLQKAKTGDLIVATTSENVEDVGKSLVWLGKEEVCIGGHSCIIRTEQNTKFLAHLFRTRFFQIQKEKRVLGTKVIELYPKNLAKIKIILPPLSEQERIVSILDKFNTLTNSLSEGLPKEIEQRQKQYEYWREQLPAKLDTVILVVSAQSNEGLVTWLVPELLSINTTKGSILWLIIQKYMK